PPYTRPPSCPSSDHHSHPHSFPTRRSSDLHRRSIRIEQTALQQLLAGISRASFKMRGVWAERQIEPHRTDRSAIADAESGRVNQDRKSTRLNSSHQIISYAVFCLKKKKIET